VMRELIRMAIGSQSLLIILLRDKRVTLSQELRDRQSVGFVIAGLQEQWTAEKEKDSEEVLHEMDSRVA
jgi:hypothetical protein